MPQEQSSILLSSSIGMEFGGNDSDTDSYEDDHSDQHASDFFCQGSDGELPSSQGSTHSDMFLLSQGSSVDNEHDVLADGLEFVAPASPKPKYISTVDDSVTALDLSTKLNPKTPTKPGSNTPELDPLTPTANLKMLINAASPEIRNREKVKELQSRHSAEEDVIEPEPVKRTKKTSTKSSAKRPSGGARKKLEPVCEEMQEVEFADGGGGGRKEKSLGLLCQR